MDSNEYLVISRGRWDASLAPEQIQTAIDAFYHWHAQLVEQGRMKPGQRLAREARLVTKQRIVDGPYTEAKEVIGGYWFIYAGSLDEAATIAAGNPCLAAGLEFEIRPIEERRASAYELSNETPDAR